MFVYFSETKDCFTPASYLLGITRTEMSFYNRDWLKRATYPRAILSPSRWWKQKYSVPEVGRSFVTTLNSLRLFYEAITCIQLHILHFSPPRDGNFFLNLQIVAGISLYILLPVISLPILIQWI